jgi:formiminotetrahydrofolate cyclodeaminase
LARPFLDAVAAPTATPGGGSVSAMAGALAAALGQMVAGLSRKRKSQASFVVELSEMLERLRRTTDDLAHAIDRDSNAFDTVMEAFKLPQGDTPETQARDKAIQAATRVATEAPLQVAVVTVALFEQLGQLEAIAAASMRSDLQVARFMAAAGARGSLANVEINLDSLHDVAFGSQVKTTIAALRGRLEKNSTA